MLLIIKVVYLRYFIILRIIDSTCPQNCVGLTENKIVLSSRFTKMLKWAFIITNKKDKLVYLSLWLINISIFVCLYFIEVLKSSYLYLPRYYQGGYFLSRLKRFRVLNEFNPFRNFESLSVIQDNQLNILPVGCARALKIPIKIYVDKILNIISSCYFIKTTICNILLHIIYNILGFICFIVYNFKEAFKIIH